MVDQPQAEKEKTTPTKGMSVLVKKGEWGKALPRTESLKFDETSTARSQ